MFQDRDTQPDPRLLVAQGAVAVVPPLRLARYRLLFIAEEDASFSRFSGSAWRGALGHALRRMACVMQVPSCGPCPLMRSCLYAYLFETPPAIVGGKLRRYNAAPHPYVLDPRSSDARRFASGERIELGLTLFGARANNAIPYLLSALAEAGRRGVGRQRARLRLDEAYQLDLHGRPQQLVYSRGRLYPPAEPSVVGIPVPAPQEIRIELLSPLRLRREEGLVRPDNFGFADLFSSLLRRASLLSHFHGDMPLETDFKGLMEKARRVVAIKTNLRWQELTRYSTHQHASMRMGGLLGEIVLEKGDWADFWPYLWLGQWMHAGKGTTMGLGQYRLCEPASL